MKYLSKIIYILIFLVMVTSPYAGHTYAEYAKEATGSDDARISAFGVTVTTNENSFAASYGNPEVTAESNNGDNIIVPGTSGIFCEYHVTGTPEVRTKVTQDATITLNDYWTTAGYDTGAFYCPLVFTFKTNGVTWKTVNALDYGTKESLIAELEETLEEGNGTYGAGYNFASGIDNERHNCTVTWKWPFEGATGSHLDQTMERDNALGDKGTRPTISVSFDVTIEQVD